MHSSWLVLVPSAAGDMCLSDASGKCVSAVITPAARFPACAVDICVAMDASSSIGSNWDAEASIVVSLVNAIGGADSRLAVWMFSDQAQQIVAPTTIGEARKSEAFKKAVREASIPNGGTNAGEAIKSCTVSQYAVWLVV